jgi:hypothetical protein
LRALKALRDLGFRVVDDRQPRSHVYLGNVATNPTLVNAAVEDSVDPNVIKALVQLGASPVKSYANVEFRCLPWHVAYETGYDAIATTLQELGASGTAAPTNRLVRACKCGKARELADALLSIGEETDRASTVVSTGAIRESPLSIALREARWITRRDNESFNEAGPVEVQCS